MELHARDTITKTHLMIALLIVFVSVHAMRDLTSAPVHAVSLETLHMARVGEVDTLTVGDPPAWHKPLDRLLSLFPNASLASVLFGMLFAIGSTYLLYKVLGSLGLEQNISTLIWIFSPLTVHTILVADGIGLVATLQLFAAFALLQNNRLMHGLGIGAMLLSIYHSPWHLIITLAGIVLLYRHDPALRMRCLLFGFGALIGTVALHIGRLLTWWPLEHYSLFSYGSWISDLGGLAGISIFASFLGLFGLVRTKKWLVFTVGLIALGLVERSILVYAAALLCVGCSRSITYLRGRKWATPDLKEITLLLILCGIVFSPLAYARELGDAMPSQAHTDMLVALEEHLDEHSVVFTSAPTSAFLQHANFKVVLPLSLSSSNARERLNQSNEIFHGYNVKRTLDLLASWNATHLLITPSMTHGGIWDEPEQGLAFLVRNEHFDEIYREQGFGLWNIEY